MARTAPTPTVRRRESEVARLAFPFEVVHVGEAARNMDAFHWHDFFELSFVERGAGRYEIEGKTFDVRAGDIVIINDTERHRVTYDPRRPLHETVFHFTPQCIWPRDQRAFESRYLELFRYDTSRFANAPNLPAPARSEVRQLVHAIVREYRARPRCFELMIKAHLLALVALLLRHARDTAAPLDSTTALTHGGTLDATIAYLRANFAEPVTLSAAARRAGLNSSYFSDLFKRTTGIGFAAFVRRIRVQAAIRMIIEGRHSLARIALACGFRSRSAFQAAFRSVTGATPAAYRTIQKNSH